MIPKPSDYADPVVTMVTSMGSFSVELFPDKTPTTVSNFLRYTSAGFYTDTIFHRVIDQFVVQGGGYTHDAAGYRQKYTLAPIRLETNVGLSNLRGSLAMARTDAPDSATSQFYINTVDNTGLDYQSSAQPGYAVFGKVIDGLKVIDKISTVKVDSYDVPLKDITIFSAHSTKFMAGNRADYSISRSDSGIFSVAALNSADSTISLQDIDRLEFTDRSVSLGRQLSGIFKTQDMILTAGNTNSKLSGGAGNDWLIGGDGQDTVSGGNGNDTIEGGPGNDIIDGGAGIDTVTYTGAKAAMNVNLATGTVFSTADIGADKLKNIEYLIAGDYADALTGSKNVNSIFGGKGDDTIDGGLGNDVLVGGAGADTFCFNFKPAANNDVLVGGAGADIFFFNFKPATKNRDRITDFETDIDKIQLNSNIFTKLNGAIDFLSLGTKSNSPTNYLIYDINSGKLSYDADGNGLRIKPVDIAIIGNYAPLSNSDIVII